jgi:type VI secretion system secreted protein VgrG
MVVGVNRSTQVGSIDSNVAGSMVSVMISPPGEYGVTTNATSTTMEDKKIVLTTGAGATITMEGDTITIEATNIFLFSKEFLGAASFQQTVVGGATGVVVGSAGGDVAVHGGPMVKINP